MNRIENQEMIDKITLKIKEIIQTNEEIKLDDDLTLIGLDSLNSVNLVIELEGMFGIEFEDEELLTDNFSTIRKVYEKVCSKLKNI